MSTTLDSLPKFDLDSYKSLPDDTLTARIQAIRDQMNGCLVVLGHHYQQDHVIALADLRGDSYRLSQLAAENDACRAIAFCGVHFMAETADILANHPEKVATRGGERITVFLPDAGAGCSMADMAAIEQIEEAWNQLGEIIDTHDITPVTYINSAASLKAFVGKRGGIVCTSSNAKAALEWAFARTGRVMFFPDQHLGRNTALKMGIPVDQMPVWNPYAGPKELGGNTAEAILASRVILWRGYCSVHQAFRPENVQTIREFHPGIRILVHPECCQEVFEMADAYGSTAQIIRLVESAPPG
ncbi:MAG: quinolinate synthase NadA, partial [Pirellulales bacterium]|nr:quinolinate synthase NadA [Pirellulales bacterium]